MEDLELVVLPFIVDPYPSQVRKLTAAAAQLLLPTAGPFRWDMMVDCFHQVSVKLCRGTAPASVEPQGGQGDCCDFLCCC